LEDNITAYLKELSWEGVDWILQAQDRDQGKTCEPSNEPSGSAECREFLDYLRS
jgi:hypothetical protein